MRLVASPLLEPEDIDAIRTGYESRESILERTTERQFNDDAIEALAEISRRRLECIAWMIGEGRLDIKLAVPSMDLLGGGQAIYHEKMGVFLDGEGSAVAFTGSPNETVGGLANNFESLEVYVSWDDPHDRVVRKKADFMRLWSNLTPQLTVLEFPEAAKRQLLRFRPSVPPEAESPHHSFPRPLDSPAPLRFRMTFSRGPTKLRRARLGFDQMAEGYWPWPLVQARR